MSKTYIQLGRTGDILNLLPLLWADAQAGKPRSLMVASEFSGVLDGVSYVNPVIFEGSYAAIDHAVAQCKRLGREWLCTQVNGPVEHIKEFTYKPAGQKQAVCSSYQKESWKVAGRLKEWDRGYPLVFDRRDPAREKALVDGLLGKGKKQKKKPLLLLSLAGISSPFGPGKLLERLLKLECSRHVTIIDLGQVHAERIYDLLALYERASMLVATDSAPLHLARAVKGLNVIALINDKPLLWHGSSWQPQHKVYCRYGDFESRFDEIIHAIGEYARPLPPWPENLPVLVHVFNAYDPARQVQRVYEPNWYSLPIQVGSCGRDSKNTMAGEAERIPYFRDCLRMGLQVAREGDYVVVTKEDTQLRFTLGAEIRKQPACYVYREENNRHVPVVDVFAARKDWWEAHLNNIPDFLFGRDHYWPHGIWAMFEKNGARRVSNLCFREKNESTPAP